MNNKALPYASLAFLCVLWGTVYPVIKLGVTDIPPFFYNTIRQFIAGIILLVTGLIIGKGALPGWKDVKRELLPAFLMISVGQGFVGWALMVVPSGLTALLISILPVYVIIIEMVLKRQFRINKLILLGLLFGVAGMLIVFRENLQDLFDPKYITGIILTLIAGFCWAGASIYVQKNPTPLNNFMRTGIQLTIGSFGLLVFTLTFEDPQGFGGFTSNAIFSLTYMVFLGSIAGFLVYFYALSKLAVIQVSIVTYVNPLVAAVVGWWFLGEDLSIYLMLAFALTMIGVFLINRGHGK